MLIVPFGFPRHEKWENDFRRNHMIGTRQRVLVFYVYRAIAPVNGTTIKEVQDIDAITQRFIFHQNGRWRATCYFWKRIIEESIISDAPGQKG